MPKNKPDLSIEQLEERLRDIAHIASAISVLHWDQDVHMPPKGADYRAKTISHLSGLVHQKFVALDSDGLLTNLKKQFKQGKYSDEEMALVREVWRDYSRQKKLPEAHVRELAELSSKAPVVWAKAREKSDFKLFQPLLEKMFVLQRRSAEYLGFTDSPYDALLDMYEPGMTVKKTTLILGDLKKFLIPFIAKIKTAKAKAKIKIDTGKIEGDFPIPEQFEFNKFVAANLGYDLDAGRIDPSTHPFTINFNPHDVRFTTRYNQKDLTYALGSTIHEAGHALYEQGLLIENFGTPIGEAISLGVHESQSRMWENLIGQSEEFWKFFYPHLQKRFPKPFKKVSLGEFYKIINAVNPSFIRTGADEVTYNIHIIIRFEIEKEVMEGTLEVKDIPKVWNQKMQEYLGVKVPDDRRGVLQDVHWSSGLVGYFPTYSFGNLYSAQLYVAMRNDIPDLEKRISKGDLKVAREWLRKKIHIHGRKYTADELLLEVTGESLNSKHFEDYLTKKYTKLYNI